jgi:sigma-B regulation protein RsbU (phosphoserine phosphatase)
VRLARGDNPAWAAPGLGETGWQHSAQWKLPLEEPHLWARCHADLSSLRGTAHPAVQISLDGAYQLFVNGVRVGEAGNVHTGFYSLNTIRQYPMPATALETQPAAIALRMTFRDAIWTTSPLKIQIGDGEVLAGRRAVFVLAQSQSVLLVAFWYPLIGIVGLMLLGLYYYDRSRRDLLYLSVLCACQATLGIQAYCASALMDIPWALSAGIGDAVSFADTIVSVVFYFALVRRPVPRLYRIAIAAEAATWLIQGFALLLPPGNSVEITGLLNTLSLGILLSITPLVSSTAPFVAFWPYRKISPRMRPIAALCLLGGLHEFIWFGLQITIDPRLGLPNLFAYWQRGLLETGAFLATCVLVGLLALLFRDQRRVTEERALLAGEMQAASEIQHMLEPVRMETAPGLHIDVAFHPMRDVGGDFYFCRVLGDGRQRVLVGDVSGKGAAAAMAATLLLGATAARDSDSPDVLLAQLNRVLHESRIGGFATCLCADFTAAGDVTLANAGHLPPYCNSREIALPSSLPLGIVPATEYAETMLWLAPGETLMFLSDGVAEARNPAGELFGFERTRQCSNQPAEVIAAAAQQFGQEDDITVLSVTRTAELEAVPA